MFVRKILGVPFIYDLFQLINGAKRRHKIMVRDYIGDVHGLKVLDLGCGTCDILEYLEGCDYVGEDLDSYYIESARKKYANRKNTSFICEDVNEFAARCNEKFDIVLMMGILHHINDEEVNRCMESIRSLLSDGGRFISFDGAYVDELNRFERFLLNMDRGQYVRTVNHYVKLQQNHWKNIKYDVRKDMMYLPYNIIVFNLVKE